MFEDGTAKGAAQVTVYELWYSNNQSRVLVQHSQVEVSRKNYEYMLYIYPLRITMYMLLTTSN